MSTPNLRDRARGSAQRQSSAQVARQEHGGTNPRELVASDTYRREFSASLPSHVDVDAFITAAQGALKRNEKLEQAARNAPASFFQALREAARLGHVPGSDEYYLTVRSGAVLGVEGYRGVIERIYRAGAASTVIVEAVCERDSFVFRPGIDDKPQHAPDWFGDRGDVIGAYAYAVMKDGATSKVVIVDGQRVARARSASAAGDKGPWSTDYRAMVLKTAAHDLEKWVPTSAEYRREQLRVEAQVAAQSAIPAEQPEQRRPEPERVDVITGEIEDVTPEPDVPPAVEPPPDDDPMAYSEVEPEQPPAPSEPMATSPQLAKVHAMLGGLGIRGNDGRHEWLSRELGRTVNSANDLTRAEASRVIEALEQAQQRDAQ